MTRDDRRSTLVITPGICPFCGSPQTSVRSEPLRTDGNGGRGHYVGCGQCFAQGPPSEHIAQAIHEWNEAAATLESHGNVSGRLDDALEVLSDMLLAYNTAGEHAECSPDSCRLSKVPSICPCRRAIEVRRKNGCR